ncbi:hypothetical protein MSHI_18260 [Mycobacterium shinjukuense]|uniref:Uncharacterized protein n=1 Tax=Mycobacterium shinjukuense TaxID=398694 RepID=A0A7I7MPR9_9MYCO|nr:hypothetical protein MSHI_01140 [Mycobacterium shinjukuense]BBX73920.1 hypothetical protein MSHI_18260 [Mycobacterium shinjukuense]
MSTTLETITAEIRRVRGGIGADRSRGRPNSHPDLAAKYQRLHGLRLERAALEALAAAPRPTNEQLARVAALLIAGGER